jgi:hypothetical protein
MTVLCVCHCAHAQPSVNGVLNNIHGKVYPVHQILRVTANNVFELGSTKPKSCETDSDF